MKRSRWLKGADSDQIIGIGRSGGEWIYRPVSSNTASRKIRKLIGDLQRIRVDMSRTPSIDHLPLKTTGFSYLCQFAGGQLLHVQHRTWCQMTLWFAIVGTCCLNGTIGQDIVNRLNIKIEWKTVSCVFVVALFLIHYCPVLSGMMTCLWVRGSHRPQNSSCSKSRRQWLKRGHWPWETRQNLIHQMETVDWYWPNQPKKDRTVIDLGLLKHKFLQDRFWHRDCRFIRHVGKIVGRETATLQADFTEVGSTRALSKWFLVGISNRALSEWPCKATRHLNAQVRKAFLACLEVEWPTLVTGVHFPPACGGAMSLFFSWRWQCAIHKQIFWAGRLFSFRSYLLWCWQGGLGWKVWVCRVMDA